MCEAVEEGGGGESLIVVAQEISGSGKGEVIVHDGVEFISLEVGDEFFDRIDDFGGEVGLWVDGFDEGAPLFPEAVWDAEGDVEAPAVDTIGGVAIAIGVHPAACGVKDVLARGGGDVVIDLEELGEGIVAEPAAVFEWGASSLIAPRFDDEPITVGGGLLVNDEVLERWGLLAKVVEDAVEDNADIIFFSFLEEVQEEFIGGCPLPSGGVVEGFLGDEGEIAGRIRSEIRIDVVVG